MMAINALNPACETTLREVHHSKIFAHYAKARYTYPTIHLPLAFSGLIGLSTRIYQTVHDGALAFLVVVSSASEGEEKSLEKSEKAANGTRLPYLHGEGRRFEFGRSHRLFSQSEANIKPEAERCSTAKHHSAI